MKASKSMNEISAVVGKKTTGLSVVKTNPSPAAKSSKGLTVVKTIKDPSKSQSEFESPDGLRTFLGLDSNARLEKINSLFSSNVGSTDKDLAIIARELGLVSAEGTHIFRTVIDNIHGSIPEACEKGLHVFQALMKLISRGIEPMGIELFPHLLTLHADRTASIRDSAALACDSFCKMVSPYAFRSMYVHLSASFTSDDWRIKVGGLQILKSISPRVSQQISPLLPQIIPQVTECILDAKKQVQTAALSALDEACHAVTNDDIRHLTPKLVSVIANPDESTSTLDSLLETTFVSNVDASTLALIAPLLGKALRGRSSLLKRKAARVIDNMCRLCQVPSDVAPFMPLLLPALDKVIDEIVDAEVCSVAKAAREVLVRANGNMALDSLEDSVNAMDLNGHKAAPALPQNSVALDFKTVHRNLVHCFQHVLDSQVLPQSASPLPPEQLATARSYALHCALLTATVVVHHTGPNPNYPGNRSQDLWKWTTAMTDQTIWKDCIVPYMNSLKGSALELFTTSFSLPGIKAGAEKDAPAGDFGDAIAVAVRAQALGDVPDSRAEMDEDEASLCDIEFSLAFGGKILLHNTRLRLGKGRRYGIMGKNGAGKTTLLTNIGSGNIEGIPPTLKTVYVQHDDASDDHGLPLLDEITAGKDMVTAGVTREEVESALREVNFTHEMIHSPRSALSGGWKMKVLIIRAMLTRANVLLLDEPTNHLDVASVAWLTQYLQSLKEVTCLIVSHDTHFLDNVITDVIHYESRKLVYYHGNLTHFVSIHPEAKYYYDLESSTMSFKFPTPGRLEGINSTTRAVMKIDNCTFTYPGALKPQLVDVSVKLCLSSRVAVLGANGAGKSTLIKLLVRELEPDAGSGEIWQHHNLRVAYIAQHSLHHVEQHLDSSPVDYIKWRFDGGVDKEEMSKSTTKLTEAEELELKTGKKYGDVEQVLGRRKFGRTIEYECTFVGQTPRDENKYISLEKMVEMGLQKLVTQCDSKIAAMAAGLDVRPLLTAEIQKHLDDFNLDAEFGTHGNIRRMSGGQKVKLVLAAAMWNCPHIIVLDEPTNYLDRQALGALTQAIKNYGGGVIIISHNKEFTDAICTETWIVADGKVQVQGEAEKTAMNVQSALSMKRSASAPAMADEKKEVKAGNVNKEISSEVILNPRTLEPLSKKEARLLTRCAQVAGVSLKEYVSKITWKSPEWKWL